MNDVGASLDRAAAVTRRRWGGSERATRLGLRLSLVTSLQGMAYLKYAPSLSMVLDGRKRSIVGDDDQLWGREHFLITPVDLPVTAGVVELGARGDFLAAVWQLDPVVIAEVAATMVRPVAGGHDAPRLGSWTPPLADAVARLIELMDAPEDIAILAPAISREIVLRLLQTDQAPRLLAAVVAPDSQPVVQAIGLLNTRLEHPWTLPSLSDAVRTSPSSLVKGFQQVTGMTPAHYLKRLRLGEAQRRMVVLGESAAQAASAVGYLSPSHFSRDYRAAYDAPPAADAAQLRARIRSAV